MSVLDYSGYDHYPTALMTSSGEWTQLYTATGGSAPTIASGAGRSGTDALFVSSGRPHYDWFGARKVVAPGSAGGVLGTRVRCAGSFYAGIGIMSILDVTTCQLSVTSNADGTLSVRRGSPDGGTVLGTSVFALSTGAEAFVELYFVIHNSAGEIALMVDGDVWITLTTGLDTQNTANTSWNGYFLGGTPSAGNVFEVGYDIRWYFDDTYVLDTTTQSGPNAFNTFLGDTWVVRVPPTGDGFYAGFTPSTGSVHYTLVDEASPSESDGLTATAVGDRDSLQFILPTPTSGGILATKSAIYAKKDDAGTRKIVDFGRSAGVNYDNPTEQSLSTTSQFQNFIRVVDPATSAAWAAGATIEIGVKVST